LKYVTTPGEKSVYTCARAWMHAHTHIPNTQVCDQGSIKKDIFSSAL
jgi:hypothetical protein